jgi:TatD DNase family protein
MDFPVADAHIHLADLLDRDPAFPERLRGCPWEGCASSHDEAEWGRVEALRPRLPPFVSSFGIHPQNPVWDGADLLARLATAGRIAAIGEAGFDFFADRPERTRTAENESAQRAAFEYQLALAERFGLPLLVHLRKAMDLAFAYAPRLRRLPAVIFHSFAGSPLDAESLLARGVPAYFSFGAPILNGNRRAASACAAVPVERLLAETDAPWQPPRRSPPVRADFCRAEDMEPVVLGMALIRGVAAATLARDLVENFHNAYNANK